MNKSIFLTTLVLCLIAFCHTHNFLENEFEARKIIINQKTNSLKDPDHGAGFLFLKGFLRATQLFNNVDQKDECLAILPVAHDELVEIHDILKNILDNNDFFNDLRKVIDILEELDNKLKEVEEPCNALKASVHDVLVKLHDYVTADGYTQRALKHALQNIAIGIQKYENIWGYLHAKDWENYGAAQGDLYRFVLFWDLE